MIRVLIIDSSRFICESMRTILSKEKDMYVVGCATTLEETHFLLPHSNAVLVNSTLQNESTLDLIRDIRDNYPQTRILVIGLSDIPEIILGYIEAGASGYILQHESITELMAKMRAAYEGEALVSPRLAAVLMTRLTQLANQQTVWGSYETKVEGLQSLTSREVEVLHLIAEGHTNQQIAEELVIECGTVKNHVHNILRKLELTNRGEVATVYKLHFEKAEAA